MLHGVGSPREGALRSAGHDIARCLDLLPEPQRGTVEAVVGGLGLDLRTMSQWRVRATYPDDIDVERALADRLVEDYANTALAVCGFTIGQIADQLGDTAAVRQAAAEWQRRAAFIADRDIRSGAPRA